MMRGDLFSKAFLYWTKEEFDVLEFYSLVGKKTTVGEMMVEVVGETTYVETFENRRQKMDFFG
jgi:hypothetical protein